MSMGWYIEPEARCLRSSRRRRHIYRRWMPLGGASFAAVEDKETSYSGPRVVFARLFLGGGFFGLMGFFLGAMATIQFTNVVGGTLYMPTRYRMLNSFKSSPLTNAVDNAYI